MGAQGWGHHPRCLFWVPLQGQGNRRREAGREAPRTCGVNALLPHGLAPRQEGTWTPCPAAAWVARMSHSKAAAGSKMLAVPGTTLCPPSSTGRLCTPCTTQVPRVPARSCAAGRKVGASVLGTGGSIWQPCSVSRPPSHQCGGGGSRRHGMPAGSRAQPPAWAPVGGPGHTHPPRRGAHHLHAGVRVGLCPVEAAHPAAPGNVLGEMLGRGPHFPAHVPYGSLQAALWTQAACGWSQQVLVGIAAPAPAITPSAWLHFHRLSILPSPAAVPGADRPCDCVAGAVALVQRRGCPGLLPGDTERRGLQLPVHLVGNGC